jgi:hypothetical protein
MITERLMKRILSFALAFAFIPQLAAASDFDGSSPLMCAVRNIVECTEEVDCVRGAPESFNVPAFFRIDFEKMTIVGRLSGEADRTSKIKSMQQLDNKLFLQGVDDDVEAIKDGLAWSLAILQDSGRLVLTASGDSVAFSVFGACGRQKN